MFFAKYIPPLHVLAWSLERTESVLGNGCETIIKETYEVCGSVRNVFICFLTRSIIKNLPEDKPQRVLNATKSCWVSDLTDRAICFSFSVQVSKTQHLNISRTILSNRSWCIVNDCSERSQSELRWEKESFLCLIMYLRCRAAKKHLQRTNNTSISIPYRQAHQGC